VKLWRIAAETRTYAADDLSGGGAAKFPGRWNDDKEPIVYCAPTIAIAVLETAAHIDAASSPINRFLIEIEVPPTWSTIPAGRASVQIGSGWLTSLRSPILMVPSVIIPEEWAALINPKHAEAAKITAKVVRPFEYNKLFRP